MSRRTVSQRKVFRHILRYEKSNLFENYPFGYLNILIIKKIKINERWSEMVLDDHKETYSNKKISLLRN